MYGGGTRADLVLCLFAPLEQIARAGLRSFLNISTPLNPSLLPNQCLLLRFSSVI